LVSNVKLFDRNALLTITLSFVVLATFCFSEVSYRAVFTMDLYVVVVFPILVFETCFCSVFRSKLDVNIAHHMLTDIVCHEHVKDFTVSAELYIDLFVEVFKVFGSLE